MTDKLLPCPFCGGEAKLASNGKEVVCLGCEALGPFCDTKAEAIAAWNARVNRTCRIEHVKGGAMYDVWRCSACGYEYAESVSDESIVQNYCPNCGAKVVDA